MTPDPMYRLEGGPCDGEMVSPPPGYFDRIAKAIGEGLGRQVGPPRLTSDDDGGWVYEFDPERPDVLVGRPMDDEERATALILAQVEAVNPKVASGALTPLLVEAARIAHETFEVNEFGLTHRDDVAVLVIRGNVDALMEMLEQVVGQPVTPEPIPDRMWQPTTEEDDDAR